MTSVADEQTCSIDWCERPLRAAGYCSMHYHRSRNGGDMDAPARVPYLPRGISPACSVGWCDRRVTANGLCGMHDMRARRGQDLDAPPRRTHGNEKPYCSVPRCARRADSRQPNSVCGPHRARMSRTGSYTRSRLEGALIETCTIYGCNSPYKGAGMCNKHYARARKYGLSAMQIDFAARIGKCGCCSTPIDCDTMCIDHDHACCPGEQSCGRCVRGFLCMGCNVGLGAFGDSPKRLLAAMAYLGS